MGYRSEVALAIKSDYYNALIDGIPDNSESVRELISEAEVHTKDDGILMHWDHVKWYYDNVSRFEASLNAIDSEHWYFVEIGEDYQDNNTKGCWWENPFNLGISRSIYMEK